jgi:hypothetical protein
MGLWDRIHQDDATNATNVDTRPGLAPDEGPTIAEAVEAATAPAREVWGRPGACPKCGGHGYLDRVDVVDRIQYEHCTECFHKWSVAEADTVKIVS